MAARVDPNRGPITLEHDSRPQDLSSLPQGLSSSLQTDFRYKGYPSENFFKYKEPQYKRMSAANYSGPETSRFYGKSQHFDTARPKLDDGPRNQPFGSDPHAANPGPMRGLGYDNSMEREREKNQREAMDADHDIKRARQQEELRQIERLEERRRDMEMLKNYNPWGRPGGGAPRYDTNNNSDKVVDDADHTNYTLRPAKAFIMKGLLAEFQNGYMPSGPGDRTRFNQNGEDKEIVVDSVSNKMCQTNSIDEQVHAEENLPTDVNVAKHDVKVYKPSPVYGSIVDKLGSPGGGAPLRTNSGKLRCMVPGDASIRFREQSRQVVENNLRYHRSPEFKRKYADELDMQRKQDELRLQDNKLDQLKHELEYLRKAGSCFGKPGAGAPNITRSGNHLQLRYKMYNTGDTLELSRVQARDSFAAARNLDTFDPWGKGIGNPERHSDGRLVNIRKCLLGKKNEDIVLNGYGDRARGNSHTAPESSRSSQNNLQQYYDEYDDVGIIGKAKKPNRFQPKIYHPFNKPGGGAPLMDHSGKIVTVLHGHSDLTADQRQQEALKAKLYHKDLDELYHSQQRKKQMDKEDQTRPFGEFAAIMNDKIVGKPRRNPITGQLENHHLGQSDVSLLKIGAVKADKVKQAHYHSELDSLTSEKKKSMQLHRLKDNQEGIQHHYTMEQTFGRPGGGAPKGDHLQKLHLDTIIHHPSKDEATKEYIRSKDWSEVEPEKNPLNSWREEPEGRYSPQHPLKYVRSTVTSNHANQYDYRDDYPKKDYRVGAPWATSGDRMV